jgi:hypothetical protein
MAVSLILSLIHYPQQNTLRILAYVKWKRCNVVLKNLKCVTN